MTFLSPDFQNQLIIQNPQLSSPGLGFLLSTIALFGDKEVTSLDSNNEWDNFWRELSASTTITSSWGDAIELLYTEEANKSIMVSYTTHHLLMELVYMMILQHQHYYQQ